VNDETTAADSTRPRTELPIGRKLVFSAIVAVAALVLATVCAEIALRCHYEKVSRITGVTEWSLDTWEGITYFWDEYHPRYGWTNVPGYKSDARIPFRVTINGQRLRATREYSPAPVRPLRRIAMFGDSSTFGEEVNDEETVPALLEGELRDAEVLNFGVRGYGLGQMMLRMEDEAFALKPDHVVVVVYVPQDVTRDTSPYFSHNKPVFSTKGDTLEVENVPVPLASEQPWLIRHSFVAAWLFGRPQGDVEQEHVVPHAPRVRLMMARLAASCAAHRVPLTVVTITFAGNLEQMEASATTSQFVGNLRRAVTESGVDALDLVDVLKAAYKREGAALLTPLGHWSRRGNELLARRIAEHLARDGSAWRLANPAATTRDSPPSP